MYITDPQKVCVQLSFAADSVSIDAFSVWGLIMSCTYVRTYLRYAGRILHAAVDYNPKDALLLYCEESAVNTGQKKNLHNNIREPVAIRGGVVDTERIKEKVYI